MAWLLDMPGEFERTIKRDARHIRSKRLDEVVEAVKQCVEWRSKQRLENVLAKLDVWQAKDPKEFADRFARSDTQFRREIHRLLYFHNYRHYDRVAVVDPASHPIYEPQYWNDGDDIQTSTNCYAYACDDPLNHAQGSKPQPGAVGKVSLVRPMKPPPAPPQAPGQAPAPAAAQKPPGYEMEASDVRLAVMGDDQLRLRKLIPLIRLRADPVPDHVVNVRGYYLIALVTAPHVDYHWLRQDADGMWSHKPGHGRATNLDSDDNPIFDPREATLRVTSPDLRTGIVVTAAYSFTTFYYAPRGGVRTGSLGTLRLAQRRNAITVPGSGR